MEEYLVFQSPRRLRASSTSREFPIVSSRIFKSPVEQTLLNQGLCTYQCQAGGRRGRRGIGQGFDRSLWLGPGVGHLNYLAVPGVGIFELMFVPMTTNHFPGWGISVIFDLKFLPGDRDFGSNFLKNVKSPPYAPPQTQFITPGKELINFT